MEPAAGEVTQLLRAWRQGDAGALDRLLPLVYADLRRRASVYLARERRGQSLETADLIHEAYLRLRGAQPVDWHDRAHFFALSARVMRRILVDRARARGNGKRGGGRPPVTLDEALVCSARGSDLVALDAALDALAAVDERKARVVELRFFGGLSAEETAEVLEVSVPTIGRDWRMAKSWLLRELGRPEEA
ncbi:MAG: ECF-type sigma factor [Vicinamibacteria bacterium]